MGNLIDLTGMSFGRLTVISLSEMRRRNIKGTVAYWLCECSCGNHSSICGSSLKGGLTTSCGCYNKEVTSIRASTHRMTATRPHRIWANMLTRCRNENFKDYKLYGGRGVSVCERWSLFENFLNDMGYPDDTESIDRIDSNGNYEPSNCRWATSKEQTRNKSNNRFFELNGKTQILADWAKEIGIDQSSLRGRLKKYPIEIALTTPKGKLR